MRAILVLSSTPSITPSRGSSFVIQRRRCQYFRPGCFASKLAWLVINLHLAEQVEIAAADRQHLAAILQVYLRSLIVAARDVADRAQIHYH